MNTNKNKVVIKVRDLAVLLLVPLSLYSCGFQKVPKNLSQAPVLPAAPKWLESTKSVAEVEVGPGLFPDGFLMNYIPTIKGKSKTIPQKIGPQYDIRKISDVTAQQLDSVYKGKLKGKGGATIKIAKKYGIDPLFIAGLACHESAMGVSKYSYTANNVTGQLYRDKKSGKWLPIKFKNVEECLERTCQRMRDYYVAEGRTNISKVQQKYCPIVSNKKSKDFNDPKSVNIFWTGKIVEHMKKIQLI